MAKTKAASLKRVRFEDTCTGHEETFKTDAIAYACSKDVALDKLLALLMVYVFVNRNYQCDDNSSCGEKSQCTAVIDNLDEILKKVRYRLVRIKTCPHQIAYEASYKGTVVSSCACVPNEI